MVLFGQSACHILNVPHRDGAESGFLMKPDIAVSEKTFLNRFLYFRILKSGFLAPKNRLLYQPITTFLQIG